MIFFQPFLFIDKSKYVNRLNYQLWRLFSDDSVLSVFLISCSKKIIHNTKDHSFHYPYQNKFFLINKWNMWPTIMDTQFYSLKKYHYLFIYISEL
jgi:hypothetical protein